MKEELKKTMKLLKTYYYLEVVENCIYIIQSQNFDTKEECIDLYNKMFYYLNKDYQVILKEIDWYSKYEYDVKSIKEF